jgi:hypothetical protein
VEWVGFSQNNGYKGWVLVTHHSQWGWVLLVRVGFSLSHSQWEWVLVDSVGFKLGSVSVRL